MYTSNFKRKTKTVQKHNPCWPNLSCPDGKDNETKVCDTRISRAKYWALRGKLSLPNLQPFWWKSRVFKQKLLHVYFIWYFYWTKNWKEFLESLIYIHLIVSLKCCFFDWHVTCRLASGRPRSSCQTWRVHSPCPNVCCRRWLQRCTCWCWGGVFLGSYHDVINVNQIC